MTLQSTKLETTISAMKDYKQLNYILSELNAIRLCLGVPTRHTTLAKMLDDAIEESAGLVASAQDFVIEESAGLVASAQDFVDQNR